MLAEKCKNNCLNSAVKMSGECLCLLWYQLFASKIRWSIATAGRLEQYRAAMNNELWKMLCHSDITAFHKSRLFK